MNDFVITNPNPGIELNLSLTLKQAQTLITILGLETPFYTDKNGGANLEEVFTTLSEALKLIDRKPENWNPDNRDFSMIATTNNGETFEVSHYHIQENA
jgi:hypothetical protein